MAAAAPADEWSGARGRSGFHAPVLRRGGEAGRTGFSAGRDGVEPGTAAGKPVAALSRLVRRGRDFASLPRPGESGRGRPHPAHRREPAGRGLRGPRLSQAGDLDAPPQPPHSGGAGRRGRRVRLHRRKDQPGAGLRPEHRHGVVLAAVPGSLASFQTIRRDEFKIRLAPGP